MVSEQETTSTGMCHSSDGFPSSELAKPDRRDYGKQANKMTTLNERNLINEFD
eukprot:CAMPEP_0114259760 /NCGR_PEP_ID=MMETSP0058-20121206/20073_1 /TAXON_ID=36894 /ORGANISM="Pyramimonas parkeae, CCMP726" /LENGTH=52 /DNA_ID=CAMNT_0001374845 /DNA_START=541 /DNA_END=699 /DNA_ORIENTATION=+